MLRAIAAFANGGCSFARLNGAGPVPLQVKLIDYEYSTLNDVAFDVANHFCEWAYNYHSGAWGPCVAFHPRPACCVSSLARPLRGCLTTQILCSPC